MVFGKLKAPDIVTMSGALHDPTRRSTRERQLTERCDRSDGSYHSTCAKSSGTPHQARAAGPSFRAESASFRSELPHLCLVTELMSSV